jgi:drug/metabolite transporter (DMT)-like permease
MSVLFGLLAALTWGAGDFSGGLATKRTNPYSVVIVAHLISLILLLGLALVLREPFPPLASWLWGGAAGLGGGIGLLLLYSALASGRMSVAAPVSALVAASLPVLVTALTEGLPSGLILIGFGLALAAIWLISGGAGLDFRPGDLRLPGLAGLAFGFFFLCLHQASTDSVLYPLIAVRIVSISSLLGFALFQRQPLIPKRESLFPILMSSVLDTLGNGAYALAGQFGRLDVAAVLSSLYPGATVLLAWILLKEQINKRQMAGIVAALTAIVLITF